MYRRNIYVTDIRDNIIYLIILLATITKRTAVIKGQIPFSTWLPMASVAPTPDSSLVHSFTLVNSKGLFNYSF